MWAQVVVVLLVILVLAVVPAYPKTGSNLYPPDKMANARRNIERYDWARDIRNRVVDAAEVYASKPDDVLWGLVTPQAIPRSTQVNRERGCPNCGKDIDRFGRYPWVVNVFDMPWKIKCPSCGEVYPKNDFSKYYESGKDEHGVFKHELADRSLLFNTEHPDPADPLHNYCVDDGYGWRSPEGDLYKFIGYYGHYGTWTEVNRSLQRFRDSYIYTGDEKYARKMGLMLYRMAQFYPDMDWSYWSKLGFDNSDGLSGKGKVYGRIWETGIANAAIAAYDAVYSSLDDTKLLDYLSAKTGKAVSAADIRALVERNIIHEAHDAILRQQIVGNEGMHQRTMAFAAVALDEAGITDKWLDWIWAPGHLQKGDTAGGNIARLFDTKIDADGMGDEGSPEYNGLWRRTFRSISEILEFYPRYTGKRFTDFPKYRKMFETPVRLICLDKYIPHIGDCGMTGDPGIGGITLDDLIYAYRTFGDPLYARMAYYLNGNKIEGIRGDIWDEDPMEVTRQVEQVVKEQGPYIPETENLSAYGLALLRQGEGENRRALSLYYGRNTGHAHRDTLNIELFAFGMDLMPDIGYPEFAMIYAPRSEWTSNTISHNTVVVDNAKQRPSYSGEARFVRKGDGVSAAEVYAKEVYPQTSLYQRTIAMVDVSAENFYLVDIFRVKGGKETVYSLHGPEGEVTTEGLNMVPQEKGTFAGENVEYRADLGGRENNWEYASGYQYLYNVRRDANPSENAAVTWDVVDTWKVHKDPLDVKLRINLVNPKGEVALAHGDTPPNKPGNPKMLTYLLESSEGSDVTFVSVIEPYVGARPIRSIERVDDGDTVKLKIRLASGRTDFIISSTQPVKTKLGCNTEFTGRFGLVTEVDGDAEARLVVE